MLFLPNTGLISPITRSSAVRGVLAVALFLITACSSHGNDLRRDDKWANLEANLVYTRAEQYYEQGRYSQALVEYRQFLDEYPDLHRADDAAYRIAQSLEGLGERIESANVYRSTGFYYPHSSLAPDAHLRAGEIFELEGRWSEALWDYRKAAAYEETEAGATAVLRLMVLESKIAEKAAAQAAANEQDRIEREAAKPPRSRSYHRGVLLGTSGY